ncbi:MAG: hypothetical protein JEZ03_06805 [Bacteroidales bacterium]|nr:hypothetical protein [Bacteroidales bacterium]
MVGAWTKYRVNMTKEEIGIFEEAFNGFVGVKYTPLAVATQVVNGTNYSYFCNAVGVYPHAPNVAAMVEINQKPNGIPTILNIKICDR